MNEINVASESTTTATGSITDQISALLMDNDNPAPEQKKELPKTAKPKAPEPEAELPPTDDSMDDGDEEGDEGESEADTDVDNESESEEASDEEVTWAKALGIDEDKVIIDDNGEFAGIKIKVDDKISIVPLAELIAGHQSAKSNSNKSKAIAAEKKQFYEVEKPALLTEYGTKIKDAEALNTYLEQSITKEFSNIDWNALRYSNPGEYAALVQDYNIRMEEVGKIKNALDSVKMTEGQKINQENQQSVEKYVKGQIEKAIDTNPEWADTKKFKQALSSMETFIGETYGFSKQEFAEVRDARILEIIKDAQKYRMGKQVAEKKLAKPVAKYQKTTGSKKQTTLDKLTKRAKEASGYGKRAAETDAVAELLKDIY